MSTAATQNRVSRGVPQGGEFAPDVKGEPAVALGPADPWRAHSDAVEEAAGRVGLHDGHAYEYASTVLLVNLAGEPEATINLYDDDEGDQVQLVHNFATGRTRYRDWVLNGPTEDPELIRVVVDDICRDHEADTEGMFEHLRQEAVAQPGIHPSVAALLAKGRAPRFDSFRAQVGDKLVITQDGLDTQLTVSRVYSPGSAGTSHAAGPHVSAHVRPGGYSVTLDATSIDRYQARKALGD